MGQHYLMVRLNYLTIKHRRVYLLQQCIKIIKWEINISIDIKIEPKNSDKTVVYNAQRTRLDKLSQQYYDNPFHGWLILLANPIYGGVEENIPDKEIIRIPFPLTDSIQKYIKAVEKYKLLNGID